MRVAALIVAVGVLIGAGCAWLSSTTAKDVEHGILTTANVLCILNNSMMESAVIADACTIEKSLLPEIEKLLAAHKDAARRERVAMAQCPRPIDGCDPWKEGKDAGGEPARDAGKADR